MSPAANRATSELVGRDGDTEIKSIRYSLKFVWLILETDKYSQIIIVCSILDHQSLVKKTLLLNFDISLYETKLSIPTTIFNTVQN